MHRVPISCVIFVYRACPLVILALSLRVCRRTRGQIASSLSVMCRQPRTSSRRSQLNWQAISVSSVCAFDITSHSLNHLLLLLDSLNHLLLLLGVNNCFVTISTPNLERTYTSLLNRQCLVYGILGYLLGVFTQYSGLQRSFHLTQSCLDARFRCSDTVICMLLPHLPDGSEPRYPLIRGLSRTQLRD